MSKALKRKRNYCDLYCCNIQYFTNYVFRPPFRSTNGLHSPRNGQTKIVPFILSLRVSFCWWLIYFLYILMCVLLFLRPWRCVCMYVHNECGWNFVRPSSFLLNTSVTPVLTVIYGKLRKDDSLGYILFKSFWLPGEHSWNSLYTHNCFSFC